MAHTYSVPSSESEYPQSNVEYENILKKSNTKHDYVNEWIKNVSVESEILQGNRLREEKPVPLRIREYDVLNVEYVTNCEDRKYGRKSHHNRRKIKSSPNTPRARSPYARPSSASSAFSPANRATHVSKKVTRVKHKLKKKCSMRIAELAAPSKRLCIETWRTKADVLPGIMVDRLKQHVLDQRPIVKIQDALYCFQRKRPQSTASKKTGQSKSFHSHSELNSKSLRKLDVKDLCIIFGQKIARRLSTPLLLSLSSKLEILSEIVAYDITQLMKTKRNSSMFNPENAWVLKDVSNKVTVWIADILDDLSYKLLEEDLRAIHKQRITATFKEATTITDILKDNKTQTKELEEEEGPVLDFLDDLVGKVVKFCEPCSIKTSSIISLSSKNNVFEEESLKQSTQTDDNDQANLEEPEAESILSDNKSDPEYFRQKIEDIINELEKQPTDGKMIDLDKQRQILREGDEYINEEPLEKIQEPETDHAVDKEDSGGVIDLIDDDLEQDKVNINSNAESDRNVSDVFEDSVDKEFKKTKLNYSGTVSPNNDDGIHRTRLDERREKRELQWNRNSFKFNVMFTKSNDHLLDNYVNEAWPADLSERQKPKLDTVSKSVTSLGHLFERDEIASPKQDEIDSISSEVSCQSSKAAIQTFGEKPIDSDIKKTKHEENGVNANMGYKTMVHGEDGFENKSNKIITKKTEDKIKVDNWTNSERLNQKDFDNSEKKTEDKSKVESYTKHAKRGEIANMAYRTVVHEDDDRVSHKTCKTNDSWRVHPKSAPSWAFSWAQGRGEPSEDSIPLQIRPTQMRESDVRKWCKDLEMAFCNLETWSDWISRTCKEASVLLKRGDSINPYLLNNAAADWQKLKKNIKKDSVLWKKLYQRTECNFKNSKKKYNNIELNEVATKTCLNKTTILDIMKEFESLSIALHRMIVSAEYCLLCSCKKNKGRKSKKTENLP